jgi:hypothetical protein
MPAVSGLGMAGLDAKGPSSYITGEALHTDAGFLGAMVTGRL